MTATRYVAGWDGVRALAVVAVVAFHFWPAAVPGGFIGVTVFLVLAGTLAVYRIGGEIQRTSRFDWRSYAQGRIRRLLPALLFYTAIVLGWTYITHPEIYAAVATDGLAALLYVTPWREMTSPVGYEAAFDSTPAPFVHTWSLGVEELAWVLTGISIALLRRPWTAAAVTGAAGVAGYVIWFDSSELYYSPARLLEFAVGAGLGLLLLRGTPTIHWTITLMASALLLWSTLTWSVSDVLSGVIDRRRTGIGGSRGGRRIRPRGPPAVVGASALGRHEVVRDLFVARGCWRAHRFTRACRHHCNRGPRRNLLSTRGESDTPRLGLASPSGPRSTRINPGRLRRDNLLAAPELRQR